MPDDKRQLDPKPLSPEYHKAHKQLMLWSAILFIWELIGIDLEKAKETGGNAGAIITAIKSPQAVPWALIILVAYFLFKTTIEWYQSNLDRRTLRVAKIDFAMAWLVSLLAYALYAYQAIRKVQLADLVQKDPSGQFSFSGGLSLGLALVISSTDYVSNRLATIKRHRKFTRHPDDLRLIGSRLFVALFLRAFFGSQWDSYIKQYNGDISF